MKKRNFHNIILGFLFVGSWAYAQTTNEGKLHISENTIFSTVEALDNRENAEFYNDGIAYIYSHFNNNGILDYFQKTGTTRFVGNSDQMISGMETSFLHHVFFRNRSATAPFLLSGSLEISGIVDFNEGIVDNDNFGGFIAFTKNANHINTSDYSHVDGAVQKYGNEDFTYPIGDGGYYRFAGISAPNRDKAHFEGKYYFENSDPIHEHRLKAGAIELIDDKEYWTIIQKDSEQEDVLITLSYREETTPSSLISAANDDRLIIVRWDEDTNMWINEGGVINKDNQTVTTATEGYGVFTFGTLKSDVVNPGNVIVYNGVTPNDDGVNDYFFIDFPKDGSVRNLNVMIFDRWGIKVFESDNYGINDDVFRGFSKGRMTINSEKQLPTGTYFYILEYEYGDPSSNNRHKQAGYLYLSN